MNRIIPMRREASGIRCWLRRIGRQVLQLHIPVGRGPVGRGSSRLFAGLYRLHVVAREGGIFCCRFAWFEPLFRSQCVSVGKRFRMEQLPYIVGRGVIHLGDGVQLSGKPSLVFNNRQPTRPVLSIGDDTFIGHGCEFATARRVEIGAHCLIAAGVRIADYDGHPLDPELRRSGASSSTEDVRPVTIGNDVWIGNGALILKGVRIGDRSVIGARSVVTKDVPPDTVVAGHPANIVRYLSSRTTETA